LVIDLRVPEDSGESSGDVVASLFPGFIAYVVSFAVIALNWTSHHRKYTVITGYNGRLIQLNFLLLFLVAFVPFPTSLISEYPGEVTSVVLYAAVVGLLNIVQLLIWVYAWRAKLIDDSVDVEVYRLVCRNLLVVPIVFGASILIALFWDPTIAMYSWFLLVPVNVIMGRIEARATAPAREAVKAARANDPAS
jgi:uncharacterized membrane protein